MSSQEQKPLNAEGKPLKTVGFRVDEAEFNALQEYANILNKQMMPDPTTGQPKPILDEPIVGKLIKVATYNFLMGINMMLQEIEKQKKVEPAPKK